RLLVIEAGRVHRTNDSNVVNSFSQMRRKFRDPDTGLPVLLKAEGASKQLALGKIIVYAARIKGFAVVFVQHWFWIKEINLTWSAAHEEVNHCFGPGREVGRPWLQVIHAPVSFGQLGF